MAAAAHRWQGNWEGSGAAGRRTEEGRDRGDAAGPLPLTNAPMSPGTAHARGATRCHQSRRSHRRPGEGTSAAAARCSRSTSQPARDSERGIQRGGACSEGGRGEGGGCSPSPVLPTRGQRGAPLSPLPRGESPRGAQGRPGEQEEEQEEEEEEEGCFLPEGALCWLCSQYLLPPMSSGPMDTTPWWHLWGPPPCPWAARVTSRPSKCGDVAPEPSSEQARGTRVWWAGVQAGCRGLRVGAGASLSPHGRCGPPVPIPTPSGTPSQAPRHTPCPCPRSTPGGEQRGGREGCCAAHPGHRSSRCRGCPWAAWPCHRPVRVAREE